MQCGNQLMNRVLHPLHPKCHTPNSQRNYRNSNRSIRCPVGTSPPPPTLPGLVTNPGKVGVFEFVPPPPPVAGPSSLSNSQSNLKLEIIAGEKSYPRTLHR